MSIDLLKEKECKLTSQEMYDVISFAMEAAEDNGFLNSFIFDRALYTFASVLLYPERADEIRNLIVTNVNTAWDSLLEDGTLEKMTEEYPAEIELLGNYAATWYEEYETYAHSMRGLLDTIQTFTGDIINNTVKQFQQASYDSGALEAIKIADNWGMNRKAIPASEADSESLYE